jgi:hypothetical protein
LGGEDTADARLAHWAGDDSADRNVSSATEAAGPNPKRQRQNSIGSQLLETLSTELGLTAAQVRLHYSRAGCEGGEAIAHTSLP